MPTKSTPTSKSKSKSKSTPKTKSTATSTSTAKPKATARSGARRRTSDRSRSQDAIAVLTADHRDVESLFTKYEKAGARAFKTKRTLVDNIVRELVVHASIEQSVLYPTIRRELPDLESDVLEALEEHDVVTWELSELDGLDPAAERFDPKVRVLMENVRHHVKEEEGDLFPAVRAGLGRDRLHDLGDELQAARGVAPTRPHPRSPDSPPASVVPDLVAHVVDRARDKARDLIGGDQG